MAPASRDGLRIIILGGGVAGLTTALALTKFAPKDAIPSVQIFEIRPEPATIGDCLTVAPNALRTLDHLGVLAIIRDREYGKSIEETQLYNAISGVQSAKLSFQGPQGKGFGNPPYKALSITRGDVLKGILAAVEQHENISLTYGKRTIAIEETEETVNISFEDGEAVTGDLLVGCDGVHSVTRNKHVQPERKETYSGFCCASGLAPLTKDIPPVHFRHTAINSARCSALRTAFHSEASDSVYVGTLLPVLNLGRDGRKAHGAEVDEIREILLERFDETQIPCLRPLIEGTQDFFLWPVYTLSKEGKWYTARCMLLGDAAHAMLPTGQPTERILDDAVIFSRCLARWLEKGKPGSMSEAFEACEKLRKPRIEVAFEQWQFLLRYASIVGWLIYTGQLWVASWYLWFTRRSRKKRYIEDVTTSELNY